MNTSFSALFPFGFPNLYHPIRYSITPPPPIAAAGLVGPDLVLEEILPQWEVALVSGYQKLQSDIGVTY